MKLFKKKEETKTCCCESNCTAEEMQIAQAMTKENGIKILGSGCKKCNELEKATRIAVNELNLDIKIEHISDFSQIASYGIMTTPAFVYNGKLISYGKVLSVEEIKKILKKG